MNKGKFANIMSLSTLPDGYISDENPVSISKYEPIRMQVSAFVSNYNRGLRFIGQ